MTMVKVYRRYYAESYVWNRLAITSGNEDTNINRGIIGKQLSAAD